MLKALAGNTKHSHVPLAAKPVRRVRLAWCAVSPFPQLPKESIPNAARCLQGEIACTRKLPTPKQLYLSADGRLVLFCFQRSSMKFSGKCSGPTGTWLLG